MVLRHGCPNPAFWTDAFLIILHGASPLIRGLLEYIQAWEVIGSSVWNGLHGSGSLALRVMRTKLMACQASIVGLLLLHQQTRRPPKSAGKQRVITGPTQCSKVCTRVASPQ